MRTDVLALAAGLAATAVADACTGPYFNFFNRDGDALSFARLDPALYPGTESPHLHSFDGGNALSASTDFAATQKASCTTNRLKQDKSLYWRPTLFWNGNGTGYHRVPEAHIKIYYKYEDDGYAYDEFPSDFNMIAGDPMRRSEEGNTADVQWGCHGADGGGAIFSKGFPKGFQSCKDGLAGETSFPSCWNGKALDPKNANAHMAYPNQPGKGIEQCPSTHREARFPRIFIEFWYDVSSFDNQYTKEQVPWVLSNGDPTGFGYHADFLNGWETGVLKKAVSSNAGLRCGCACNQDNLEAYFGKDNVNRNDDAAFKACSVAGTVSADSAPVLQKLPGCNPIQSGPARATAATGAGCSASAVPTLAGNNASFVYSAGSSIASAASSAASSVASVASSASSSVASAASSAIITPASKVSSSRTGRWPRPSAVTSKDDNPMLSMSLPNKQVGDGYGPTSVKASATAVPIASSLRYSALPYMSNSTAAYVPPQGTGASVVLPSSGVASSAVPVAGKSSGLPVAGNSADCSAPVTVTYTPTVYVTVGANSTSCASSTPTITKTLTQIATITVDASQSSMGYGSN